ncbi:hypothetical protein V1478_013964 [Vespula squamosa]|uniref:Uncharacterized protein n=1 Tax=Vespula squamosa TaxID=30214 RepID=A0ABD2A6N7_VESSQ
MTYYCAVRDAASSCFGYFLFPQISKISSVSISSRKRGVSLGFYSIVFSRINDDERCVLYHNFHSISMFGTIRALVDKAVATVFDYKAIVSEKHEGTADRFQHRVTVPWSLSFQAYKLTAKNIKIDNHEIEEFLESVLLRLSCIIELGGTSISLRFGDKGKVLSFAGLLVLFKVDV